ncbi:MAG: M48 family metalloprotease, partial [Thermodesulfobacteriota bacterium]
MLWPLYGGEGLTAGVMGLVRPWRYILVTRSLLGLLNQEELEAVIGHEMGHVRRRHLLWYVFFLFLLIVLAFALSGVLEWRLRLSGAAELFAGAQGGPTTSGVLLLQGPVVLLMVLYFRFVFGAFMRNFERQADLFAFRLIGHARGLISSLEKIARRSGQSRSLPSWHHFSVAQRVEFLAQCERSPGLAARHERKVRLMLAWFIIGTMILLSTGWVFLGQPIEEDRAILRRAAVHYLQGQNLYQAGRVGEAQAEWEAALKLAPWEPVLMNNLAWLLVTKEAPTAEEKARGFELARRAAEMMPQAFVLDTLAEAYFVQGRYREALATLDRAFKARDVEDHRDHLEKQREKFWRALERN